MFKVDVVENCGLALGGGVEIPSVCVVGGGGRKSVRSCVRHTPHSVAPTLGPL